MGSDRRGIDKVVEEQLERAQEKEKQDREWAREDCEYEHGQLRKELKHAEWMYEHGRKQRQSQFDWDQELLQCVEEKCQRAREFQKEEFRAAHEFNKKESLIKMRMASFEVEIKRLDGEIRRLISEFEIAKQNVSYICQSDPTHKKLADNMHAGKNCLLYTSPSPRDS